MTDLFFDHLAEKNRVDPVDHRYSLLDYPKGQESFSEAKKNLYERNLTRMLYDPKYTDYLGAFLMMPKAGEVYYTD